MEGENVSVRAQYRPHGHPGSQGLSPSGDGGTASAERRVDGEVPGGEGPVRGVLQHRGPGSGIVAVLCGRFSVAGSSLEADVPMDVFPLKACRPASPGGSSGRNRASVAALQGQPAGQSHSCGWSRRVPGGPSANGTRGAQCLPAFLSTGSCCRGTPWDPLGPSLDRSPLLLSMFIASFLNVSRRRGRENQGLWLPRFPQTSELSPGPAPRGARAPL